MALESLLKPLELVDEGVLRGYTKLSKQLHLMEGRKKYFVGVGLWTNAVVIHGFTAKSIFGGLFAPESFLMGLSSGADLLYNIEGIIGKSENEETTTESRAANFDLFLYKIINKNIRPFVFLTGIGFVGKFSFDLLNYTLNNEPLESKSYNELMYGVSLLSLASSMYIKNTDPKLLGKDPMWERAYNYLKDKASNLTPKPSLQPVPVRVRRSIEDYIQS